jgi:hypothetical protein
MAVLAIVEIPRLYGRLICRQRGRCVSSHSPRPTQPHASLSDSMAPPSKVPHHPRLRRTDGLRMSCRTFLCSLCPYLWCKRTDYQHRVRTNPRLTGSIERALPKSAFVSSKTYHPILLGTKSEWAVVDNLRASKSRSYIP